MSTPREFILFETSLKGETCLQAYERSRSQCAAVIDHLKEVGGFQYVIDILEAADNPFWAFAIRSRFINPRHRNFIAHLPHGEVAHTLDTVTRIYASNPHYNPMLCTDRQAQARPWWCFHPTTYQRWLLADPQLDVEAAQRFHESGRILRAWPTKQEAEVHAHELLHSRLLTVAECRSDRYREQWRNEFRSSLERIKYQLLVMFTFRKQPCSMTRVEFRAWEREQRRKVNA